LGYRWAGLRCEREVQLSLYGDREPLPVSVDDLADLVKWRSTGTVSTPSGRRGAAARLEQAFDNRMPVTGALPFKDLHPRCRNIDSYSAPKRAGRRQVTARGAGGEPRKVGLPRDAVAVAQLGVRQVVVPEREAGAAVRILQRHCDARAAGWHRAAAANGPRRWCR
jgi:hypothetical protein